MARNFAYMKPADVDPEGLMEGARSILGPRKVASCALSSRHFRGAEAGRALPGRLREVGVESMRIVERFERVD